MFALNELSPEFDPVFYIPELDKCLAGLPVEEKNQLSHRGKAIQAFKDFCHNKSFRVLGLFTSEPASHPACQPSSLPFC